MQWWVLLEGLVKRQHLRIYCSFTVDSVFILQEILSQIFKYFKLLTVFETGKKNHSSVYFFQTFFN